MHYPARSFLAALCLLGALTGGCATTNDSLPAVTPDGLKRIDSKNVDALYWKDGASLTGYDSVMLLDTPVAFRKDWMRDYNVSRMGFDDRATEEDMEKIKAGLSEAFREVFTETLEAGGYKVVDQTGFNILTLRPAITELDVAAPDLDKSNLTRTYTSDAGEMTLYMEFYDSVTGAKIGEVADHQNSMDTGYFQYTNRVTNRAEAERILRKWAKLLVAALDEAHGKS